MHDIVRLGALSGLTYQTQIPDVVLPMAKELFWWFQPETGLDVVFISLFRV